MLLLVVLLVLLLLVVEGAVAYLQPCSVVLVLTVLLPVLVLLVD